MEHLIHIVGDPTGKIELESVTDSQASIDILQNASTAIGISEMLRPEMEVALEILHSRSEAAQVQYTTIKVRSHIEKEAAPDENYWLMNDVADNLVTEARMKALREEIRISMDLRCFLEQKLAAGIKGGYLLDR